MALTMGWTLLLWLPVAMLLAAYMWRYLAARWGRKTTWFSLRPSGADVQWTEFRSVVGSTRRWMMSGRVLIARFCGDDGNTSIWLGIAGSKKPSQIAQTMARAAGAQLGAEGVPPWPATSGFKWRIGYTEPAPGRNEKDATESYLRALDDRTTPEKPTFPSACADYFTPGDVFLVMCRPSEAPNRVTALCLTTSIGLDMAFTEAAELKRGLLAPSAGWAGAVLAGLSAVVAAVPLLDVWGTVAPAPIWRATIAVLLLAWAAHFLVSALRTPALLSALLIGRVPRFPRSAAKGKMLPVWQLGEWAAGDPRSGTSAPMKLAPAEALEHQGALIGEDPTGQQCRLPDELRYRGVIAYGDPGVGKTTLLLNLLAHDSERRSRGEHVVPIWIETKGEGAQRAYEVMRDHGVEPLVLTGMTAAGPRLELIDRSRPFEAAHLLTEAMRYAFEADDIHEASADVLRSVFEAAVVFPADAARKIGVPCHHQPNIMELAFRILGGIPELTKDVHKVMKVAVPEERRRAVMRFWDLSRYERDRVMGPARNKLSGLTAVAGLFEPLDPETQLDRHSVTFGEILRRAQPTVINLGRGRIEAQPSENGAHDAESIETALTAQRAAGMSMFVLWHTIQNECHDWQADGKAISVFSDELKDISGFGKPGLEIVQAMADQGRSRGVLPSFGTQRPDQLVHTTRAAVDSFSTQAYFKLRAIEANTAASDQLFGEYTAEEIAALPEHWCALSLAAAGRKPAAFTLKPRNL